MWAYTLRRLLYAVPILLGVSMLVFAPDPARAGRRRRHPGAAGGAEGDRRQTCAGASASTSRSTCSIWPGSAVCWSATSASPSSPTGRWRRSCSARWAIRSCSPCRRQCWASCSACCWARWPPTITAPGSTSCSPPPRSSASACRTTGSASCWWRSSPSSSTCCRRRAWASRASRPAGSTSST